MMETFFLFFHIFWIILIALIVFWIMMIVDVVNRDFQKKDDKTMWVIIVALAGIPGAVIYYFVVKTDKNYGSR